MRGTAYTDTAGRFSVKIDKKLFPIITLRVSFVGMNTITNKVSAVQAITTEPWRIKAPDMPM